MRKLRAVRMTAVALGEMLVYSALVLLTDYIESTTELKENKVYSLRSIYFISCTILFITTSIFALLIAVVSVLKEKKA